MVKKYMRNSVYDYPRSQETLSKTLNYLFANIFDLENNGNPNGYKLQSDKSAHNFDEIYDFMSDRIRAVAKDYKKINYVNIQYLRDHEKMAKFYITSIHRGILSRNFDEKLNFDRVRDILRCLHAAYKEIDADTTGEFIGYLIILEINKPLCIIELLKNLSDEILHNPYIVSGLNLFTAYMTENYYNFFNILKTSNHLFASLALYLYDDVRISALERLKFGFLDVYLDDLREVLYFSSEYEAIEYLEYRNLLINDNGIRKSVQLRGRNINYDSFKFHKDVKFIEDKRICENFRIL